MRFLYKRRALCFLHTGLFYYTDRSILDQFFKCSGQFRIKLVPFFFPEDL